MMIEESSGKMWYLNIIKLRNVRLKNNTKITLLRGCDRGRGSAGLVLFQLLGFSLLNACLRVSQQRNEVRMKQKPTCYAGGVKSLYRKTPFRYNRVVQSLLQERKGVLWRISLMISPIQNGCVNTILYLPLSIGEKLFIIN